MKAAQIVHCFVQFPLLVCDAAPSHARLSRAARLLYKQALVSVGVGWCCVALLLAVQSTRQMAYSFATLVVKMRQHGCPTGRSRHGSNCSKCRISHGGNHPFAHVSLNL